MICADERFDFLSELGNLVFQQSLTIVRADSSPDAEAPSRCACTNAIDLV